jgi:4-hydroxy-3-methylbut-2-en-1-yl diphosphate reductase
MPAIPRSREPWAPDPVLLQSIEDAEALTLPDATPVACTTQKTLFLDDTKEIVVVLEAKSTNIQGPDVRDICYATQNR